ncbi:MAG: hypothetical protein HYW86_01695 [Candidatus Roizmanbacteria bacterium]|nr:MAG: hypothetical protein HYW86_01695 [Candidatus Roizmanbacteria bacterium]
MKKLSKNNHLKYHCPFCKKEIISSKKTEVFYRNQWIDGCYDCFALSINELTRINFQKNNY